MRRYIDFAARHGFGGVLVEGWNLGWRPACGESGLTHANGSEAGKPGDYVVVARQQRGGADWYLGAVNDEVARDVVVPLDFLGRPPLRGPNLPRCAG